MFKAWRHRRADTQITTRSGHDDITRGVLCGSTGHTRTVELSLDDLEALAVARETKSFTPDEDAVMLQYWGRVPIKTLLQYLNQHFHKNHTMSQLKHRHLALIQRAPNTSTL